ncbi:Detected protein of unknown function [Hibiscus syriacus]|uniref:Glabrous enhancer-binding protein-like DBD domain-containing protein n=1 Tax=Hibiscus syriacus TaxID=106335 RepID=A0A6A3B607_HIBSY|nr:Detected protein of unknown function [Hibiscus syriacus]
MSTPSPPTTTATPNGRSFRVFSESDEIQILKCLIRATKSISPPITTVGTPTINRIIKLLNHKFSPSQINDKLSRLRDKYHKHARNKSLTIPRKKNDETGSEKEDGVGNLANFPYLVTEFSRVLPGNEVWKEKMVGLGEDKLRKMDQEWVFLKVEEAKLVARKAELIQQQIMEVMGETGSANGV